GLVFRSFAQSYNSKFWSSVQVSDEFRRWIPELLQHLAFTMMQGESPTEFRLAINEQDAKEILTKFLEGKVDYPPNKARAWLEELLKHHLIQYTSNKQIEFRHQLLQEYYAAECLLPQIKNISDAKLKKDYINYLEWTQTLALMLALLDNEAQAVRVVKLALDVDLMLGARLAGEVKRDYQEKTVKLILDLNIHQLLKTEFLGIAHSEYGISFLISALNHENAAIRRKAADSLGKLRNEQAVNSLMTALQDEDRYVRRTSAGRLGDIGNSIAVKALIKSLDDQDSYVVWNAAIALSKINFNYNPKVKNIIYHYKEIHIWLQKYLKPIEEFRNFRQNYELDIVKTKDLLKKNHNIDDIKILIQDLNSQNLRTRWNAEEILCKIGTPKILKKLWNLYLNNLNNYSSHNEEILNVFLTIQNRYLFYNFSFFACCLEGNDRNKSVKNSINRQEYEEILSILSNMSLVMERDTATFSKIGEEALRQHFLVQLNGRYKGQATGETFNSHGKTDILIRVDGKNIFIAECKFWGGSKLFQDTINQLLGYATWRDTKLAILIFNRNKNFSVVLEQIPPEVSKHPNFIRQLPYESETGFRFIIHHPDDKQRELILTVLAFDIPSETQH
ncbi:MAG TPA: HEAT repeat domain-containing protein, partial [Nostocaceae cyanobacterium]|nr:HEAT repeat domain-containing protein [Nostocaceae cyanobacterium]